MERRLRYAVIWVVLSVFLLSAGCKEETYESPWLGPAAGDAFAGGGEAQGIKLFAASEPIPSVDDDQAVVTILAIIESTIGQPMPQNTPVIWTATIGALTSQTGSFNSSSGNGYTTETDEHGQTGVKLQFPEGYSGCSWVTAHSGDASVSIQVCTEQQTIMLTTTNDEIAWTNDKATISNGQASVQIEGQNTSGSNQMVTVTAATADGRSGELDILVQEREQGGLYLTAASSIITATGSTTITATVLDNKGNAEEGVLVSFSIDTSGDLYGVLSASGAVTNSSGRPR